MWFVWYGGEVKVVLYTFVRRGVRTLILSHRHARKGGQLLSSPPLSPQFCHQVPIRCWVNSEQALSQGRESGSNRKPSTQESWALTAIPTHPLRREARKVKKLRKRLNPKREGDKEVGEKRSEGKRAR